MGLRENLQALMEKHGENSHSLSGKVHVPQPTIFRILDGTSADPRRATVAKLAKYFGVSVEELHNGNFSKARGTRLVAESPPAQNYHEPSQPIKEIIEIMERYDPEQQSEIVIAVKMFVTINCKQSNPGRRVGT